MAVVKNLMVRVGADFSSITQQSKKAAASVKQMGGQVKSSCSGMSSAFNNIKGAALKITAAVAAAKAVYSAVSESVEAYKDQAEAEAKLGQVMRNTMGATEAEIQRIKELTSAQQALGVVGDEVQLAGAQELGTYLELSSSLEELIPAMNDMIAQQYGLEASCESAVNIATMMGKVMEGQTGALSRYGYYFDEAQEKILKYGTEAERAATLATIIEESVGGVNAALANTPTGQMQQLKNALGDVKEQVGQAALTFASTFLPILQEMVAWLSRVAAYLQQIAVNFNYIFGGTVKNNALAVAGASADTAASVEDIASAYDDVTSSSKKAQKSMMGIDTLTRLGSSGSGSAGGLAETATAAAEAADDVVEVGTAAEETQVKVSKAVAGMRADWLHLQDLWKDPGKFLKDTLNDWKNIFKFDGGFAADIFGSDWPAKFKKWFIDDGIVAGLKEGRTLLFGEWEQFVKDWNSAKVQVLEFGVKIKDKASDLWQGLKTAWGDSKSRVVEFGVNLKTRIGELWNQLKSAFTGRKLSLQVSYSWPSSKWQQSILSALGLSGWPHLSFAAKGGIVDSATLFGSTVVGEAGKEAIIPLENNTGWMDGVANRIGEGLGSDLAAAVNSGNNEQNSLLREQNKLLRALLDKELTISPSASLGKVVSKSASMYARATG